jgi:hypothetical protein
MASDPDALVTQSPDWIDAICAARRWQNRSRMYETPDGRLAVVPLVADPRLRLLMSPPEACGFGGIVAEGGVRRSDIRAILADLGQLPAVRCSIRPNPLHAEAWATAADADWVSIPKRAHVIDLTRGASAVWDGLHKSRRRQVRRAEERGVEITCDATESSLASYFDLYEDSLRRWAERQHEPLALARLRARRRDPPDRFRMAGRLLGRRFQVWSARHEGRAVAVILTLQGTNAHTTRSVMARDLAAPLGATALLEWSSIQAAEAAGCRSYHMGESGTSVALAKNKEEYGAMAVDYFAYRRERLPLTPIERTARAVVKRAIGFRD